MNRSFGLAVLVAITGGVASASSQSSPLSTEVKTDYQTVRDYFVRAAEEMPDSDYRFKPSPDVRTFGQQVAHDDDRRPAAQDDLMSCADYESDLSLPIATG